MQVSRSDATTSLTIALAALTLGALGDTLLRATPWGVNLTLWLLVLAIAIAWITRASSTARRGRTVWQLGLIVLFAVVFAWRDTGTLKALDLLAILASLAATALRVPAVRIRSLTMLDACLAATAMGLHTVLGAGVLIARELPWARTGMGRYTRHVPATTRGVMLGIPLVLLFGGLFASADAAFAGIAGRVFHLNLQTALSHAALIAIVSWAAAGFLRGLLLAGSTIGPGGLVRRPMALVEVPAGTSLDMQTIAGIERFRAALALGRIEIGIVLGLLDALFLSFVAVQFRYFFGGAALVEASSTLTYAEYARRGFFELVAVVALVLPLLLALDWVRRQDSGDGRSAFRLLAGTLLALVAVVMVSAVQRMRIYQAEYGLTELRFYTTAFMAWIALVLVWFAATVLRGRRNPFAFGAAATALLAVLALNMINPSGLIVRVNADRSHAGRPFDAAYATSLGADAVPQLIAAVPTLAGGERCYVTNYLLRNWGSSPQDWRTWTLSREQARRAVRAHRGALLEMSCR
jgi:hypothetical protein